MKIFHTLGNPLAEGNGGSFRTSEGSTATGEQKAKEREFSTGISADQYLPASDACLPACHGEWGLGAEAQTSEIKPRGENQGWLHETA